MSEFEPTPVAAPEGWYIAIQKDLPEGTVYKYGENEPEQTKSHQFNMICFAKYPDPTMVQVPVDLLKRLVDGTMPESDKGYYFTNPSYAQRMEDRVAASHLIQGVVDV